MTSYIVALIFLGLAFLGIVARKTYYHLPVKELKRLAAKHDKQAVKLYPAVAYERSLRALLWLYIGLTSAVSIIILCRNLPVWLSLVVVGPLLWVAFSYVPATKVSSFAMKMTLFVTPAVVWILNYLHPMLSNSSAKIEKRYSAAHHTKLFERDDLIDLIQRQKRQPGSRFTDEELDIAQRALKFSDQSVSEVITPRKSTKSIMADDLVGPVLIDELYKSRQKYVLVQDEEKGPFIGVIDAENLGINSSGLVRDLMRPCVYYLHEDDSLGDALKAFFITNFPVFVVVNEHEDFVGIVSVEQILKKLMGHIPGDEFSEYSDISAVASRHKPKEIPEPKNETEDSPLE